VNPLARRRGSINAGARPGSLPCSWVPAFRRWRAFSRDDEFWFGRWGRPALPGGFATTVCVALLLAATPAAARPDLTDWPDSGTLAEFAPQRVTFASHSPFTLSDVGVSALLDPPTTAEGYLFLPAGASAASPVPAVVLLHGASGVKHARELTYGAQFAKMGVAVLVVDAFAARRDRATRFIDRLLEITETMLIADAYAGLRWLDARPAIDGDRVALIGFSYGGMSSVLAAYRQVAERFNPTGPWFAGHIGFYGPCIARFDDTRATGAPVLMLAGSNDAIVDPERCRAVLDDLAEGGARTELVIYDGAYHQWDGGRPGPYMIGRNLADCSLNVNAQGVVRDTFTLLPMTGSFTRKLILAACTDSEGYLIGNDDSVRAKSNRAIAEFLEAAFENGAPRPR
jgi:dienelactone hydrolase